MKEGHEMMKHRFKSIYYQIFSMGSSIYWIFTQLSDYFSQFSEIIVERGLPYWLFVKKLVRSTIASDRWNHMTIKNILQQ